MSNIERYPERAWVTYSEDAQTVEGVQTVPPEEELPDWVDVEYVRADIHTGAVCLSENEWNRVLQLLHRPVPPGPLKELDEEIIGKINHARGQ